MSCVRRPPDVGRMRRPSACRPNRMLCLNMRAAVCVSETSLCWPPYMTLRAAACTSCRFAPGQIALPIDALQSNSHHVCDRPRFRSRRSLMLETRRMCESLAAMAAKPRTCEVIDRHVFGIASAHVLSAAFQSRGLGCACRKRGCIAAVAAEPPTCVLIDRNRFKIAGNPGIHEIAKNGLSRDI